MIFLHLAVISVAGQKSGSKSRTAFLARVAMSFFIYLTLLHPFSNHSPMKFQTMKLVFLLLCAFSAVAETKFQARVNKLQCSSSGKTASNMLCYIKAFDRGNPLINGGMTLNRQVPNGLVCLVHFG